MIHLVFDRPRQSLSVFDSDHRAWMVFQAEGDAWGRTPENNYGHDAWMPPGHFLLRPAQSFSPPIASEGFGQIPIVDMDPGSIKLLMQAGDAKFGDDGDVANIGGILGKVGQLSAFGRSDLMIHGGGSNAPDPFADEQELCKTEGCTRMHNGDWKGLAAWLSVRDESNVVVLSAVGDPVALSC